MNELDETFDEYLKTIKHQDKLREILVNIYLTLELNSYPKMENGKPTFFLENTKIIGFNSLEKYLVVYPGVLAMQHFEKDLEKYGLKTTHDEIDVPWDLDFPYNLINKMIKSNEALILDDEEGIDYAED